MINLDDIYWVNQGPIDALTYYIDYFGVVAAGDDLPYIPSSMMSLVAGFVSDSGLSGNMRLIDVGSSCSVAACGTYNKIHAHTIVDLNLRKALNDAMDVYVIVENVTDDEDIISRACLLYTSPSPRDRG